MGARYPPKIRKKIEEIKKLSKKKYRCPKCDMDAVVRVQVGIWRCKKCNYKFAGPAYYL
ncbi:MAG: 50S ribosomal protein L37ae [Candidatus Aenigmarchaeota archaeon]|nr:50S ribosomal protein L37ae [Candidatus Aenigmarchaeota archaeon]MDW8149750.1 50S ribosomal protein L37ae [Candidatus Aenigmarchaeota archaeon]